MSGIIVNKMILIENGTFMMGDKQGHGHNDEMPHTVKLSSYYIGKYPITQNEFKTISNFNPSEFNINSENCPVENVTWFDAIFFCNQKSLTENLAPYYEIEIMSKLGRNITNAKVKIINGKGYRLPTEAEWEYAAKGGEDSHKEVYSGGEDIDSLGWSYSNSNNTTHNVGLKLSNSAGIYDMSGNVLEWCQDWYETYKKRAIQINPRGPLNGASRIRRGGSWGSSHSDCRVSYRSYGNPFSRSSSIGFRIARSF